MTVLTNVLAPVRRELRGAQVDKLRCVQFRWRVRVAETLDLDASETPLPPGGEHRFIERHPVGVVAMRDVEVGALPVAPAITWAGSG